LDIWTSISKIVLALESLGAQGFGGLSVRMDWAAFMAKIN
jgi:hypothetical protein